MPSFHVKHRALEFVYNDPTGRQNGRLSRLNLFLSLPSNQLSTIEMVYADPKGPPV